MDIRQFMAREGEKPLDNIVPDGGFCKIFRTIGFIGDSLSSGEFESTNAEGEKGYHDFYDYSWGQYIAREAGLTAYNFSKGGMSAKVFCESFAETCGVYKPENICQAYVLALGVNDILNQGQELGSLADLSPVSRYQNAPTFAGYYAQIIQNLKTKQPQARFFLMTMPRDENEEKNCKKEAHAKLLYDLAAHFDYTYVLDLYRYAPVYDAEFRRNFYLGGHMNAAGYVLTSKMVMSYIDYLVRHNPEDFAQVGFIGKPFHNMNAKW